MLEIVLLILGGRKIHQMAKSRGLTGGPFIFLFVLMWFVGELIGAVLGELLFVDFIDPQYGSHWKAYMLAILSAMIIGGAGFGIGVGLPLAIGGETGNHRRGRRGDTLDPDSSFDLPGGCDRGSDEPREKSMSLPPHTDDDKRNDTGFRPYPDR